MQRKLNVFADQPGQVLADLLQPAVKVEHAQGLHLLAAEGEQLAGEIGGPPRGLEDLLPVMAQGAIRRERVHHQLSVAADDHEQIIEVVGYAPGQLPDGIHLLHLRQLLFQLAAFGDVAIIGYEMSDPALGIAHRGDGFLRVVQFAILFAVDQHPAVDLAPLDGLPQLLVEA